MDIEGCALPACIGISLCCCRLLLHLLLHCCNLHESERAQWVIPHNVRQSLMCKVS